MLPTACHDQALPALPVLIDERLSACRLVSGRLSLAVVGLSLAVVGLVVPREQVLSPTERC